MRSRIWIAVDIAMLVAVVVLQAWRLTGVPIHEWLAVALLAGVLAHLVMHWPWVASRSRRILKPRMARTRVNFALNLALFIGMVASLASGFVISKVVTPFHLAPDSYVKWHGIHDFTSRVALFTAALHLALNWDVLFKRRPRFRFVVRPAALILVAGAIVTGAVFAYEAVMPRPDVELMTPRGRIEHAEPPPDIAKLTDDEVAPSARGIPAFVLQSIVVAVVAVLGRTVLRLRLD